MRIIKFALKLPFMILKTVVRPITKISKKNYELLCTHSLNQARLVICLFRGVFSGGRGLEGR